LRIANFMDSPLSQLKMKGNLSQALRLYNPKMVAEKVVHFTPDAADRVLKKQFEAYRVEVFPYYDRARAGILGRAFRAPGALWRVIGKLRREKIDLIRGRLPYFGSLMGCIAGRLLGIPTVVSLGGNNRIPQVREGRYHFGSRWISFGTEAIVLRLCDVIIAPNRFTLAYVADIIGKRAADRKVQLIPWIIDEPLAESHDLSRQRVRECGVDPDRPFILLVGHLNRYKYTREMIEVAARVLSVHRDGIQFVFCGDGPLRAEGERKLAGISGVHFIGWQPNAAVLSLIRLATVVLVPMSGFVLLEAAALGASVVASAEEWHNELIRDGKNGLLVRPGAVDEWCDAIYKIFDEPEMARVRGNALRVSFRAGYAPDVALDAEAKLYKRLVGRTTLVTATG
jgi:glycosyltransferase involved in cell wall biosynthesis